MDRGSYNRRLEQLEADMQFVARMLAKIPVRVSGGGGGGMAVLEVETRGDLPTTAANGQLAVTTAESPNRGFMYVDSGWYGITHGLGEAEI